MTIYINFENDKQLTLRAAVEDDEVIGDIEETLSDGDDFMGHTYDELRELGEGEHEIEPRGN